MTPPTAAARIGQASEAAPPAAEPIFPLAQPPRLERPLSPYRLVRGVRNNAIAVWPEHVFDTTVTARRIWLNYRILAHSPTAIKRVLVDNADNYVKGQIARRLLRPGLGDGLVTSEGALWRRQRRIIAPMFQHKRIAGFVPAMAELTAAMLDRWDRVGAGAALDFADESLNLTLRIIARTMFSTEADLDVAAVGDAATAYQLNLRPGIIEMFGLPEWTPRLGKRNEREAIAALDAAINRVIARRRRAGGGDDLLAMLLAARDEDTGAAMSDKQVRDEVATILMAGHETTANALNWTFYLLAAHPSVRATLEAEVARVLGERPVTAQDIEKLTYTRQVIEESMRLYPPAHTISRAALAADELDGVRVPRGATVVISPWVMHRHRKWWDDPERFDPSRFAPERAAARPRFTYLPFGGGPRICIGAAFALTEAVAILATIARRYRLRLAPDATVEPVGLITLRPRDGLKMMIEPRRPGD
jgi:cytochrome P450